MRKLDLVGLDSEGRHVVFADDAGNEYVASADDRLRATLRGDRARLGQLEIDMDSSLRPRDIQARIRAGESVLAVAAVAQVSADKIMPYCVPVLAERRHVADLARRHHVRRRNAEGPAQSLDTVVSERLRSRGVNPDTTQWDSWRREDGRWTVHTTYQSGEREHTADFVFDAVGRYSLADDDEARWLTGEQQSTRKGPQPREPAKPGERRLSAVRDGDDLLSLSGAPLDDELTDEELSDDLTAVVRAVSEPEAETLPSARLLGAGDVDEASVDGPDEADPDSVGPPAAEAQGADPSDVAAPSAPVGTGDGDPGGDSRVEVEGPEPALPDRFPAQSSAAAEPARLSGEPAEPTPDRRRRTARRASVPSWDEIMFGKTKDDQR